MTEPRNVEETSPFLGHRTQGPGPRHLPSAFIFLQVTRESLHSSQQRVKQHPGRLTFVLHVLKVTEDLVVGRIEGAHLQQRQGGLNWERFL